jgi:hypothetical protein
MTHIVDSLRKHQKMTILGAALGVIALYIIPVDQIVAAIPPQGQAGIARAVSHIQDTRDRISANTHIPPDVRAQIDQHLYEVQQHLLSL